MSETMQETANEEPIPFTGKNEAVSDEIVPFIERVEEAQSRIDDIIAEAKEKCAPMRDEIKDIKLDCHEATNVARAAMNHVVSKRRAAARMATKEGRMAPDHLKVALEILAAMPEENDPF